MTAVATHAAAPPPGAPQPIDEPQDAPPGEMPPQPQDMPPNI